MIYEKAKKNIILALMLWSWSAKGVPSAITYMVNERFGACLFSYCNAKWIAYKYNLSFLYAPFLYSNRLIMHDIESQFSVSKPQFNKMVPFRDGMELIEAWDCLYTINFLRDPLTLPMDWADPEFKKELKKMIQPKQRLREPYLPQGYITVAVHVKKETTLDYGDEQFTLKNVKSFDSLKWLPHSYYIEQIKKIGQMFPDQKLYLYLFTDYNKPQELVDLYRKAVNCNRIIFDCRAQNNRDDLNVVEDFFALTKFDCLIRSCSYYSMMASKIADYKVMIAPLSYRILEDSSIVIDQVILEVNSDPNYLGYRTVDNGGLCRDKILPQVKGL
jgi:hypothetical protein